MLVYILFYKLMFRSQLNFFFLNFIQDLMTQLFITEVLNVLYVISYYP